ncbi:MAG: acyl-[acyl-carrier-protein] thioesterase [Lachnospiraceae bacterium]
MYQFESRVRYSESDANQKMKAVAILNYFQDVTTFESTDLGFDLDKIAEMGAAWMVSSWQLGINRYPVFGEKIIIHTWPYDFKGFLGYRNFTMENEKGEVLAYASSIWMYMDLIKQKPTRIPKEVSDAYTFAPPYPMENAGRKIQIPPDCEERPEFAVRRVHIDTNQHVNNEKYIVMAMEYLPPAFEVGQLRAEYKKAAVLGDHIYPKVSLTQDKVVVVLADEKAAPYATMEFLRKE